MDPGQTFIIKECLDVPLIFVTMENHDYTAILLLDLPAAFDTIIHQILLDRLKEWFGIGDDVIEWLVTYLKHCFQSVKISSIQLYADDSQVHNYINTSSFKDSIQNSLASVLDLMNKN